MAREVALAGLGLAGRRRFRLFTARKLCVKPLDSFEKHLHFGHCSRVVLSGLGASRVNLPAHLALLACADILGPAVSLSEPPSDGLQLFRG